MTEHTADGLVACHECDLLHALEPVPVGARADCSRCGAELYRNIPESVDRCLALYVAALMLLVLANIYPFIGMKVGGLVNENHLVSGGLALYRLGMGGLGAVVFLTSILFPAVAILGMIYLLLPVRLGVAPPGVGLVYRVVNAITPWSLVGVFMLGTLISVVKLQDLATVVPGIGLFAFVALLVVYSAAGARFDAHGFWAAVPMRVPMPEIDVRSGHVTCHTCDLLHPSDHEHGACLRCGAPLHGRIENSIARTWALVSAALILLVPANVYPVMTVIRLGRGQPDTILSGVVHLIEGGMIGLALIVFFASIVVPVAKLGALIFLLWSVQSNSSWRPRDRTLLYRVTEVVGAWSMVDVFLVGLLTGLVSLEALATITPGLGVNFFAAVVIITMFAAHSFDPRLIWDHATRAGEPEPEAAMAGGAA